MTLPILHCVRVIDCATGLAGSVAALMLAEAGAEVIKVERRNGNPLRGTASFAIWNRSKKSIALDIGGSDRETFTQLLAGADMLIHDTAPGEAVALGLDPATLSITAPHLIRCTIRGLPDGIAEGPLPLDDALVLAAMGVLSEQPALNREGPTYPRFPLGSWCAAWLAAIGVATRLLDQRRGGAAGAIDTSLFQGAMVPLMMLWRHASTPTSTFDGRISKGNPPSLFECADGIWLHIMKNPDDTPLMKRLLKEMGPDGVAEANKGWPPHHRYTNMGANAVAFRSRPSAEWLEDLWANDVAVQAVQPMGALYRDAQAQANGYVIEVDDLDLGTVLQPGHPVTLDPPARMRGPAPRLDADREALLAMRRRVPASVATRPSGRPLLEGIRVVDFGNYLAGPLTTMMLADLGAEVIKVEPLSGDPLRGNESAFLGCQRGKRSIALDLASPAARPVIERLVGQADVVQHNLRMPAARRFGLDYSTLRALNPRLVYGHVSAYGPQGPRRDWPGYDQLFQAQTGWELANAGQGNPPTWLRFGMMDHLCAMSCAFGLLLALIRREDTGEGSQVGASLLGASILTMSEMAIRADDSLTPCPPPLDQAQMGVAPGRRLARCADGWILFVGPDAGGLSEADMAALDCASAIALLTARGFQAVRAGADSGEAFLFDPDKIDHGLVARYPHPIYGELRHPGGFWSMPDAPLRLDRAPPTLGQHSGELLDELGFTSTEIAALAEQGAVKLAVPAPVAA